MLACFFVGKNVSLKCNRKYFSNFFKLKNNMEDPRVKKRIIISSIFFTGLIVIGLILYFLIAPSATCTDGIQNQAEKGIDCGGTCAPCKDEGQNKDIVIKEVGVAIGGNNTYDVAAKISNPNDVFGASIFHYTFKLKDIGGSVIAIKEGNNFILPADSKYVAVLGIQTDNNTVPVSVDFVISDISWNKLENIGKPQIGVYNKNFGANPAGEGSVADGLIRNQSGYGLSKVSIVIILRSESGDIIGINATEKNTVNVKEERDFRLTWPYQLSAPIQNMEVDVQSNVFDSQNFFFR